jgi:hypothetical protein
VVQEVLDEVLVLVETLGSNFCLERMMDTTFSIAHRAA